MALCILTILLANILVAFGGRPEVKCPAPISPANGQIFITKAGIAVKYTCNPGFELKGPQLAICKNGEWYPEAPTCVSSEVNSEKEAATPSPSIKPRPLFKWDDANATKDENNTMQGDDTRIMYVRRWPYYHYRAPLHADVVSAEDNVLARENALRYHYYWNSHYPRRALVDYRLSGLSESQWAWINSLHPETREKYLQDLHKMGVIDTNYLNYVDGYQYALGDPYYVRQPLAVVADDMSKLDYSCHRTERDGRVITIKAPKLPNAYIHRYDRRQNPHYPHNNYLATEYRCKVGYTLLDSRVNELYCSQSSWVGHRPVCVPRV